MRNNNITGLYFITDSTLTKKTIIDDVIAAIKAGVKIIQYRDKDKPTRLMHEEAKKLRELTRDSGAILIINDRIDIALAVDADGVHLGQDDMGYNTARKLLGDKIIGITVHNIDEAIKAKEADYLGVSPIFDTKTKQDAGKGAGIKLIEDVRGVTDKPLVAIGGINYDNISDVIKAGADSTAVISAILIKDDVELECKRYIDRLSPLKPANVN